MYNVLIIGITCVYYIVLQLYMGPCIYCIYCTVHVIIMIEACIIVIDSL